MLAHAVGVAALRHFGEDLVDEARERFGERPALLLEQHQRVVVAQRGEVAVGGKERRAQLQRGDVIEPGRLLFARQVKGNEGLNQS